MSGTSADGVDVAVVAIRGTGLKMTAELKCPGHRAYGVNLRRAIFSLRAGGSVRLDDLARTCRHISLEYAEAVKDVLEAAGVRANGVAAVAAHGQTLYHAPPDTVQLLDPALLASEVGCAVVSDFRRADCAAGGQGAPLVPFADYVLFRHPTRSRVLLNIGGIANITYIPAGASIDDVVAFDTGPGNCISDDLFRRDDPGGKGYDDEGYCASIGSPINAVIDNFLSDPYFSASPPKSTDGPAMILLFNEAMKACPSPDYRFEDFVACACVVTARSIARAMPKADEVFVSGGGVYNPTLMRFLAEEGVMTRHVSETRPDIGAAAKEAVAFALLGAATLDGVPSNVPSATGARRPVVLGSITPKP